jgi:hypothetical protein
MKPLALIVAVFAVAACSTQTKSDAKDTTSGTMSKSAMADTMKKMDSAKMAMMKADSANKDTIAGMKMKADAKKGAKKP